MIFFLVKSGTLREAKKKNRTNLLRSEITGSMFLSMTVLGIDQDRDHHFMCSQK